MMLIGIGGGSAAGKSTLAGRLAAGMSPLRVLVLNQDHFYKPADRLPTYHSAASGARYPDYNHSGSFDWRRLSAACRPARKVDVVIVEGILALYDAALRRRMALKIWVECPRTERTRRLLRRGVPGWAKARHLRYIRECVLPGHIRHVAPTRRFANVLVSGRTRKPADR